MISSTIIFKIKFPHFFLIFILKIKHTFLYKSKIKSITSMLNLQCKDKVKKKKATLR